MSPWKLSKEAKRTVESLQKAYKDLFKENPYNNITAVDIAKRAGVSRTTFYQYFRDKDDIFLSLYGPLMSSIYRKPFTKEELLAAEPPSHMIETYQSILASKVAKKMLTTDPRSKIFAEHMKGVIHTRLRNTLTQLPKHTYDKALNMPLAYIANHEISTLIWWLGKYDRRTYTSEYLKPHEVAQLCHQYRREIIITKILPLLEQINAK